MKPFLRTVALLGSLQLSPAASTTATAQSLVPIEGERPVAGMEFGTWGAAAAIDPAGRHVVFWHQGFYGYSGRGFRADAEPASFIHPEPWTYGASSDPVAVAVVDEDRFLVVREDDRFSSNFARIVARPYTIDGQPLAEEITVVAIDPMSAAVFHPSAAAYDPGETVIVWAEYFVEDGDLIERIRGQVVDENGPFLSLNVGPPDEAEEQWFPEVETLPGQALAFVWQSVGSPAGDDQDGTSIQVRTTNWNFGSATWAQANERTAGDQVRPDVAFNSDGTFLVVWAGPATAGDPTTDIFARPFGADGAPSGAELRLSAEKHTDQFSPRVVARRPLGSAGPWDGYFVAWNLEGTGILGLELAADGSPVRSPIRVDLEGAVDDQIDVAVRWTGETLVTWRRYADEFLGQYYRRFRPGIFTDGFESGTTEAWSITQP